MPGLVVHGVLNGRAYGTGLGPFVRVIRFRKLGLLGNKRLPTGLSPGLNPEIKSAQIKEALRASSYKWLLGNFP